MLVFEKTDDHISCGIKGDIDAITADLIYCIGMVHQKVKETDEDAANVLRVIVERFCKHGGVENKMIFEHFGEEGWLGKEIEKSEKKTKDSMGKMEQAMREFYEAMKRIADDNDD